ncbi:MAG: hypothetical protein DMG57_01545 [Acidobacteria bacterium]|nr:MAG: hypothetical protein DMG57_01545 [Acidobacteriota bacterium]
MLVEILHTVRISIRSHNLVTVPFLVVGLIASIRRMFVAVRYGAPDGEPYELLRNSRRWPVFSGTCRGRFFWQFSRKAPWSSNRVPRQYGPAPRAGCF